MGRRFDAAATVLVAMVVARSPDARADVRAETEAPAWITARDGKPFRVGFDPGHRLFVALLADTRVGSAGAGPGGGIGFGFGFGMGLSLRAQNPHGDWDVFWKRDHEIAHLVLRPLAAGAPEVQGRLYRGTFIRRSRSGALTIPTTPPLRLPVPFDIGLRIELGRLQGVVWPEPGASALLAGVVRGDVLADFWRSPRSGRWIAFGVGARYDISLARELAGALNLDHRIAPMTALTLAARTESDNGLFAGSIDIEGTHRWSSVRGWEQAARAEVEAEIIPLAVNDQPLSLLFRAGADWDAARASADPDFRALLGLRISAPLR